MQEDNLTRQVDEIQALSAIYEKDWTVVDEELRTYSVRIPLSDDHLDVNLRVTLPPEYPADSPPFYQLSAPWLKNAAKKLELSAELETLYWQNVGESVLYLWIEKTRQFLQNLLIKEPDSGGGLDPATADLDRIPDEEVAASLYIADVDEVYDEQLPSIIHGEPITVKRSTFQAHLSPIVSTHQVSLILEKLKLDKKIAGATHNMYAYRIYNEANKSYIHDCDDDGETHAGSRLLHLLEIVDARNVLIVVSRWYGGVHLGPDRFRQISNCARNILLQSGLIMEGFDKQLTSKSKLKK